MNIQDILDLAMTDNNLHAEHILSLLKIHENSPWAVTIMALADKKMKAICRHQGQIWYAIGLDNAPCPHSCNFCSLSAHWRKASPIWQLDPDQVVQLVHEHDQPGISHIVLRTTTLFPLDQIVNLGLAIGPLRHAQLTVNVGDFSPLELERLALAGFQTAYHTWRLGEGVDTDLEPHQRLQTIAAIQDSPLELAALVEPVGLEHRAQDLVQRIMTYGQAGVAVSGAMARVNIPGTPKANYPTISPKRLAFITAIVRLSLNAQTHSICSHPPSLPVVQAGANTIVVESGANPRDLEHGHQPWRSFTCAHGRILLQDAGYKI